MLVLLLATGCDHSSRTAGTASTPAPSSKLPQEAAPQAITSIELELPSQLPAPAPVRTVDGRYHLVYQLQLVNLSPARMGLKRLDVIDADSGAVVSSMSGAELRRETARVGSVFPIVPTAGLGPDQAGIVFVDASFKRRSALPHRLANRLVYSQVPVSANLSTKVQAKRVTRVTTGAQAEVDKAAPLVLHPPLHGPRWADMNGCCRDTAHTRIGQTFDGVRFNPERFGIDFISYGKDGLPYTGDARKLANWLCYGSPVYAVAAGRVVTAVDHFRDNPLLRLPAALSPLNIAGNQVIIDLGSGRYAAYAHLVRGSLRVRRGEHVRVGEVIGRLGNSGASGLPHLHFQVMNGPAFLASEGVPYVFDSFALEGRVVTSASSARVRVMPMAPPGRRTNELPLYLTMLSFADS